MSRRRNELRVEAMNADQLACYELLCELFGGAHHVPKVQEWGDGIAVSTFQPFATFDSDRLTHLVFLAHERCVRAQIESCSPRHVRIALWKRHGREGRYFERHPSIDEVFACWRIRHPLSPEPTLGDADAPQRRADGPREPSTTPSSVEGPAGPRPLSFSTAEHVDAHVRALLVEQLGVDEDEVTDEAKFWDDLGADSLDLIELVMACEDDFEIEIPDEVAEGFVTVGPAIAWITRRVLEKAGPK